MATSGGQPGNQNAAKAKIVFDALRKAAAVDDWKRLQEGCGKVMDAFAAGEPWAVQFVADRFDGKPAQAVTVAGDADSPVQHAIKVTFG